VPGSPVSFEPQITVVLAEVTPVVAAILKDAAGDTGIRIVEPVTDRKTLSEVVAREHADVVIVPTEKSGFARQYHELLQRNPEVKVLTIAIVSRSADLYELCFLGKNIGERGVVEAIRAVMGRKGTTSVGPSGG
jgi:hypothetical protein